MVFIKRISKKYMKDNIKNFVKLTKKFEGLHWYENNFLIELDGKWNYSFYAEINMKLVGFIICSKKNNYIHVHRFMVDKEFLNEGIGTKLLCNLCEKCISENIDSIQLKVDKKNIQAISFYNKYGFENIEIKDNLLLKSVEVKKLLKILKSKVKANDTCSTTT
ncbi:GNAT family N-acetyltransferase [Oceanirhabdus sp. W0125-5]|uniref:GNAT family N-acetyltransferase n=1 Tax=Oceanirhabdus sp. W0125-5 TaxID=2999116 RepID=UPI0022F31A30|nr:GNAT family N-acetyltransferase [Oceanirhabdus sp. W0125-5]WBW96616.1 GNAT family N-acetyltransferase [Oceanirhabdus sp. W0125-5]